MCESAAKTTGETRRVVIFAAVLVVAAAGLLGCAGVAPERPLPETITEDFFPLTLGTWWEFESTLPGFPDDPMRDRFQLVSPDARGRWPVRVRTLNIQPGVKSGSLAFERVDGYLRMYRDEKPVNILRFGARPGDTWAFNPDRPQYRAHLTALRWEKVLAKWRPVAVVHMHAGGLDAEVVREFWFARGVGWMHLVQKRSMGSEVRSWLVDAQVRPPSVPEGD